MAKNLNFYFDNHGVPRARGPHTERLLMNFLESDVQGSDYICHDLMNDLTAIEDESAEVREFVGNAHSVLINAEGVVITCNVITDDDSEPDSVDTTKESDAPATDKKDDSDAPVETEYRTGLKHFREILADWEAFILDEQDPIDDSMHV